MKKVILLIFINIVLALFQTAFFPTLFGKHFYINWVLLMGLAWFYVDAPVTAMKSVFIGGTILDVLTGSRPGLSPAIMTLGLYVLILIKKSLFKGFIPNVLLGALVAYIYILVVLQKGFVVNLSFFMASLATVALSFLTAWLFKQIIVSKR